MSTWDAARLASRRPLHKPVSFIGRDPTISDLTPRQKSGASGGYSPSDKACQLCGHHVCSCPPKQTETYMNRKALQSLNALFAARFAAAVQLPET